MTCSSLLIRHQVPHIFMFSRHFLEIFLTNPGANSVSLRSRNFRVSSRLFTRSLRGCHDFHSSTPVCNRTNACIRCVVCYCTAREHRLTSSCPGIGELDNHGHPEYTSQRAHCHAACERSGSGGRGYELQWNDSRERRVI